MLAFLKIVGLGVLAAITFGIALDNVTARICVEYFTIGHIPIFGTENPTLLAFGWGILASWWVGLGQGIFLAIVSRIGPMRQLSASDLIRPVGVLLGVMAIAALLGGLIGYIGGLQGWFWMVGEMADRVPKDRHARFLADAGAHMASYGTAFLGGIILAVYVALIRRSLSREKRPILVSENPARPLGD